MLDSVSSSGIFLETRNSAVQNIDCRGKLIRAYLSKVGSGIPGSAPLLIPWKIFHQCKYKEKTSITSRKIIRFIMAFRPWLNWRKIWVNHTEIYYKGDKTPMKRSLHNFENSLQASLVVHTHLHGAKWNEPQFCLHVCCSSGWTTRGLVTPTRLTWKWRQSMKSSKIKFKCLKFSNDSLSYQKNF